MRALLIAVAVLALAAPAAGAHISIAPTTAPAAAYARLDVRVPNERDDKGTVKLELRLPDGFYFASYKKVPGWSAKLTRERLDRPVDLGEFSVRSQVTTIVWTGNPKRGGIIRPDQFEEFGLSVRVPDGEAGSVLVFKAIQTCEGGERVRWTGAADSETPAPRVTLTAATGGH